LPESARKENMKVCPVCGKEYSNTSTLCPVDGEVLRNTDDPLIGVTLAGKYLVEEMIKRGGMGAVYRGKHVLMDKRVAIKVLRPSLAMDDDVVARFSREAKAASRISHPHAVSVTDFGEGENGVVFLVMEYLDGQTLKEVIKTDGAMSLERTAEIVRQVSGALDAAHEQGVIHRDLKSDNIMLSQTNGGDWAKVLDFGIAKIQQPNGVRDIDITAANLVIGTPQYMSPEQCSQSGPIDARSDVYSLGIIIYEMLAGRVPFTGESPTVIMMKQVQDEPPSLSEARRDLPAAVAAVVSRALAKQPDDRFKSAGELSKALAEASELETGAAVAGAPVTVANAPVVAPADDLDEETIVTPRHPLDEVTVVHARRESAPLAQAPADAPPAGVNPWRILLPAAIVLVAVFGVVFLLTRGSGQTQSPNANVTQPGLVADPNSQPVQAVGPPSGESERNIQAQPSLTPTPREANANVGEQVPATSVNGNFGSNSNRNTNQRESPTPKPSPKEEDEPPPPPKASPTIQVAPKPTPSPE
jgi:serine/threonine-protein kinase